MALKRVEGPFSVFRNREPSQPRRTDQLAQKCCGGRRQVAMPKNISPVRDRVDQQNRQRLILIICEFQTGLAQLQLEGVELVAVSVPQIHMIKKRTSLPMATRA